MQKCRLKYDMYGSVGPIETSGIYDKTKFQGKSTNEGIKAFLQIFGSFS